MNQPLLETFKAFSDEELELLRGRKVQKQRYTQQSKFLIDKQKFLHRGQLINIRAHTRFAVFPRHMHNYVEILYMYSGSTTHILNDRTELTLGTGDLLFIGKGCWHEILPAGMDDIGINFIVLPEFFHTAFYMMEGKSILSDFVIDNLIGKSDSMPFLSFHVADILPIQNLLENLIWSIRSGETDQHLNEITMGLLFLQLMKYSERAVNAESRHPFALNLLQYLDAHYDAASLTEFAAQQQLSLSRASRRIKDTFGVPFQALLQKKRMEAACAYLSDTRLPVTEIIARVGYENKSYFYRKFRSIWGISPREYRMRQQISPCK